MFKPCIIIPVYNHRLKIAHIVNVLLEKGLPCYLLDDGSDAPSQQELETLRSKSGVTLLRWDQNRGKGAVVCDGLVQAEKDGYTHALQVDADGQHDLSDIAAMLAKSEAHQHSVVSAWRDYADMPKGRRNGRRVTDVWVWINTLSLSIKDSMCGFRVYPLKQTCALLAKNNIGRRMDFDTDILVRLYWRGADVEHVKSRTLYSDEIPSHFDLWRDNVRISIMHTRLFFGMLIRFPQLLFRRKSERRNNDV